jgi:hypothetical protein
MVAKRLLRVGCLMMRANDGVDLFVRSGKPRLRKFVARVSKRCVCYHIALLAQPELCGGDIHFVALS